MLFCHCIVLLQNKQITAAKSTIVLSLVSAGTSVTRINMLSDIELSVMYQTIYNNLQKIEAKHEGLVHKYFSHNCQQLFILNIDDYHDLHESRQPNATLLSRIAHMATLLINTLSNSALIPFFSSNNYSVHNPNGIKAFIIKKALVNQYMVTFNVSYNARKSTWSQLPDISILSKAELIESLTIYSYDADITEKHIRNFNFTKLIDFILTNLKNTDDYLKALNRFIILLEVQSCLNNYIIPVLADFPDQLYIR
ncbi:unnamed protein product [Rhizophagus irregularis]|nr:unnamed protein product [Rhizophagus irregularis]